jgi:hypothetical protein
MFKSVGFRSFALFSFPRFMFNQLIDDFITENVFLAAVRFSFSQIADLQFGSVHANLVDKSTQT